MSQRILHVLDPSTPADAVESLAVLFNTSATEVSHHLAVLGHRSTENLLAAVGLADRPIDWLPSMGWADPTGWRALRRAVRQRYPTHIHAWGLSAAIAATRARAPSRLVISLAETPSRAAWTILRALDARDWRGHGAAGTPADTVWTALSQSVARDLRARLAHSNNSLAHPAVHVIPTAILPAVTRPVDMTGVRDELGLEPDAGPILLLAGDARGRARHDVGLWVGGILQEIFPRIRVIVREDPRGRRDVGLERLLDNLSDGHIPVLAPAEFSWDQLLTLADVLLVTADGPVAIGAALHAMAAGIPVVGTPIEPVHECIEHNHNGLIAADTKPRAITARVEQVLNDPTLRQRLVTQARLDVATQHSSQRVRTALERLYEGALETV